MNKLDLDYQNLLKDILDVVMDFNEKQGYFFFIALRRINSLTHVFINQIEKLERFTCVKNFFFRRNLKQ